MSSFHNGERLLAGPHNVLQIGLETVEQQVERFFSDLNSSPRRTVF